MSQIYEINTVILQWLEYLSCEQNCSENTINAYRCDVLQYLNFIKIKNTYNLQNIQLTSLHSWLSDRIGKQYLSSSNARAISALKNLGQFLKRRYNIIVKAFADIQTPKYKNKLPKSLNHDEITILTTAINEIHNPVDWIRIRNKALILLLYSSGMRISEVLNLEYKDLKNDFILIKGKGMKERIMPWIPCIKKIVKTYVDNIPYCNIQYIFLGHKGKKLQPAIIHRLLVKIRNQYCLPQHLSAHTLRHTFSTHLLENGADIRSIQELLGHQNLITTERYTKVTQKFLRKAYDKFHTID